MRVPVFENTLINFRAFQCDRHHASADFPPGPRNRAFAPLHATFNWLASTLALLTLSLGGTAWASLDNYDTTISEDASAGLNPLARLSSPVTLTGSNKAAFNFGTSSGSATIEFILQGDPTVNPSAYLAVGTNSSSNLRYDLWNDTGQLGFTQLGVMDYAFTPGVPSPTQPAHVTYVWNSATSTMKLFLNGKLAGTCSGVSPGFAVPSGPGWLGANPQGGEPMVGTIYRVTVYDGLVSEEVILSHANAFNGVVSPPEILSFTATPDTIFFPGSTTLTWDVRNATSILLNGADVSTRSNLTVAPSVTSLFTLAATNASAVATAQVRVQVNPAPIIRRFAADRTYAGAGDRVILSWDVSYAKALSISPAVGDVTAQSVGGLGSVTVQPAVSTSYLLTASSDFGSQTALAAIHIVQPASHLVISEFMADDKSTLADEDGTFTGWIEIHNPTAAPVNLSGYFLTDNAADLTRWGFPNTNLDAGAYLVVFASVKNRVQPGAPLHTNFRLNNSGEYLALVGPGPVVLQAFAPAFPAQRPDISYGILADDVTLAQFMSVPTPGAANDETPPPPAPVRFSRPSGTFTEPFALTLSAPDPNAEIRFTVDGSAPGLTTGALYSAPIQISSSTRMRAVATAAGFVSLMAGASYIKLAPDLAGYTSSLPIMIVENFGAGVIKQKGWNATGAGIKQVPRQAATWVTFEPIGGVCALTNAPQMLSLVGIRGRGAYSTEWRQKPYSVQTMDEDGSKADVSPLGMPAHSDWVLYFPDPDQDKDPALLFNTFAYDLSRNMGHYAARFRWVEAFIHEDGGDLSLADRRGVYAIMEKIARGKDRLDFQPLSADGATGGWLLDINRMDPEPDTGWPAPNGATQPSFFHTPGPNRILQTQPNRAYNPVPGDDLPQQWNAFINFDTPNGYVINTNQRAAVEGWFKQFEKVLYDDTLWRDPANGYRRYLDTVDFADYFVLNVLTRNGDGLLLSMFPWKGDDDKLRMGPAWDYNWSAYYISGGPTGSLLHRSDQLWYARLFADPDFMQLYIDRWWTLRRSPMSNAAMAAIIDQQAADITPQKSLLNGMPSTAEWSRRLQQMKTWLSQRADWIDANYLRPPLFNQDGGDVPDGFAVVITGSGGTIYVTTDGTDPRAPGGAISSSASTYAAPLPLHTQTFVQARIKSGSIWSGLTAAVFSTPQDLSKLALTEIMYQPAASGNWTSDDLEFLELKNTGGSALHLGLFKFTSGIEFTFTNNTRLEPGEFFVLARDVAAFEERYPGVSVNGLYTGKLNNGGETIRLATPSGQTVFGVSYSDASPWPASAGGQGFSLVPFDPAAPNNSTDGGAWRASTEPGGSPGRDDPADLNIDSDGDGMLDWQEVVAGTDPNDPESLLKFDSVALTPDLGVVLTFRTIGNKTYTVEYTDDLEAGIWSRLTDVAAQSSNRKETVADPGAHPNRFYRLVTPQRP